MRKQTCTLDFNRSTWHRQQALKLCIYHRAGIKSGIRSLIVNIFKVTNIVNNSVPVVTCLFTIICIISTAVELTVVLKLRPDISQLSKFYFDPQP